MTASAPPATDGVGPWSLETRGIERQFGRAWAVRGVDLQLPQAASVALLGANGAGKSTLLRMLAQVLRPSAGTIRVLGLDPHVAPSQVRRQIGFVGHELGLYLDLSVDENLEFWARLQGLGETSAAVQRALEAVVLVDRRQTPVRSLSRGLQQRAALARAVLGQPALLLLDEPWTGLDRSATAVLVSLLDGQRSRGATTVFTTHDLRLGHEVADFLVVLADGRLVLVAPRAEVSLDELEELIGAGAKR